MEAGMYIPLLTNIPYRDIPGTIIVELREVPPHMRGHGFTLAKLRAWLGGDEGYITDPYRGERHLVSLKPWLQTNPDVELVLFFDFIFDQDYVRQHPELFPPPPARPPAFIRDTRRKEDDIGPGLRHQEGE
jgi:hypothetical protein